VKSEKLRSTLFLIIGLTSAIAVFTEWGNSIYNVVATGLQIRTQMDRFDFFSIALLSLALAYQYYTISKNKKELLDEIAKERKYNEKMADHLKSNIMLYIDSRFDKLHKETIDSIKELKTSIELHRKEVDEWKQTTTLNAISVALGARK